MYGHWRTARCGILLRIFFAVHRVFYRVVYGRGIYHESPAFFVGRGDIIGMKR